MGLVLDLFTKYGNIDAGDITTNQKKELRNILSSMDRESVKTIEEHEAFIKVVQLFRKANAEDAALYGGGFLDTLKSLLSVGEDGVYSNSKRFLYELIQNVDDCEYEKIEECKLKIKFEYHEAIGKIILIYNEKGFTPKDVFGITGIAEKIKNISADKIEIGEKGIGFKSIFGIAERVLVESGLFCFELDRDDFTIPIPRYEDYKPVSGTRMTIMMSPENAKKTFRSIMDEYKDEKSVLNQNPILFLNKLTHLKIYYDNNRYIEFDVQRKDPILRNGLRVEENVIISADMKDHVNGQDIPYKMDLLCNRYTLPIVYGKEECCSRYGDKIEFSERRHNIIAVFAKLTEKLSDYDKGVLYSFLPTQIKINAPMVMHVPFKLDGSREFVHPQDNNLWFTFTMGKLSEFLKKTYVDLAHLLKQEAIYYIPNKHNYLFNKDNQKVECLCVKDLQSDVFLSEKVFCVYDGSYESSDNVVAFPIDITVNDPVTVYKLLREPKKLFIPSRLKSMRWYNCTELTRVYQDLFKHGLLYEDDFEQIAEILCKLENEINYFACLQELGNDIHLSQKQLVVISKHKKMEDAFVRIQRQSIADKKLPPFRFDESMVKMNDSKIEIFRDSIDYADLSPVIRIYLNTIEFNILLITDSDNGFALAGKNGLALSRKSVFGSFSRFIAPYDDNKMVSASLQIRQGSERLNAIDDTVSNDEYLGQLRDVRKSLKVAYGDRVYANYIQILNKAGADKNRFLNELLQNADDCSYEENAKPAFALKIRGDVIEVEYNEKGFTKNNVRAITAIGESTKNVLLRGETSIGEKGVGFKSVFGVASEVEIHSNGFDFKLNGKTPTIPEKCEHVETAGTLMRFKMKNNISSILLDEYILSLCLCLRKLKEIIINGKKLSIEEKDGKRNISYNGKRYHFDRVELLFDIKDEEAFKERSESNKEVSRHQKIVCFIPKESRSIMSKVYVGLPTNVSCNVPLLIDAPFELTTSRDGILKNKWNEYIRNKVYEAILNVMEVKKEELRIDVLQFIKFDKSLNGVITLPIFSDNFLNTCNWREELRCRNIMPRAFCENEFIAIENNSCIMVPDVVAEIGNEENLEEALGYKIIDTFHKSQYVQLLEYLGIKKTDMETDLGCISRHTDKIALDSEYRKAFYIYLYQSLQMMKNRHDVHQIIKRMPVFPIKTMDGTRFVSFENNIYRSQTQISDNEFFILDESILPADRIYMYTGENINELTQEVYDAKYQKRLLEYIQSDEHSLEEKARFVLKQYLSNRNAFEKCKATLKGVIDDIPMKMANGEFGRGNKFINKSGLHLSGEILSYMFVDKQYQELAEYLGCEDVLYIHYDDIDYDSDYLTDDDIDEIQMYFEHYTEILGGYINAGKITAEQIEKFNLQCYVDETDEEDDIFEEFPGMRVKNLESLQEHIREQFKNSPNPYVEKQRVERVPKYVVNDKAYTEDMYRSVNNESKCFCQMCRKMVLTRYIERNNIQVKPQYAWEQMYLSLCLTCSKDYILLRNNRAIWERFLNAIREADVSSEETIEIEIGNSSISFTATHLAEIQEILKVMPKEV